MIRSFEQHTPQIGERCLIASNSEVIGDVILGEDCSVWPATIIRGDVNAIRIGCGSNFQDGSVLHVTHASEYHTQGAALQVGNRVTVGHKVILHGCSIGDTCLIGMGSIVMDDVIIESRVILGAGSLVTPGKRLQSGYLYLGSPCRKIRPLTDGELTSLDYSAQHYIRLKNRYLQQNPDTAPSI